MTNPISARLRVVASVKMKQTREYTIAAASEAAKYIDEQDAKIKTLVEVAHKVPERWAWGRGPNHRCRVCKDCGAVGTFDSWDSPLPHKKLCTYTQARAAISKAKETQ